MWKLYVKEDVRTGEVARLSNRNGELEHGMPRGARKWEMFEHRDFVN